MTTPTEPEQLIELISGQTRTLLQEHWTKIENYRDGEAEIKIGFSHALRYEGNLRVVKTMISFSHSIRDQVEDSINTVQTELPLRGAER
jgi:hypothetical protein